MNWILAEIHTVNALFKKTKKDIYELIRLTPTEVNKIWKALRDLQASIRRDAKDFTDGWLNYCMSREEKGWPSSIRKFYSDSEFCGSPATFSEYMSYMSACEKKKIAAYRAYSVIIAEDKKKEEEKRINAEQAYKARCDKNAEAQRLKIDSLNALVAESGDAVKKAHAAAATAKSELKESENKRKEAENKRKEVEGLLMGKLEEAENKRKEAEGLLMSKLEEAENKRKEAEGLLMGKLEEAENKRKEAEGLLMGKLEEFENKRKEAQVKSGLLMGKLEESENKRIVAEGLLKGELEESEKKREDVEWSLMAKLYLSENKRKEAEAAKVALEVHPFVIDMSFLAHDTYEGIRIDAKAMETHTQDGLCKVSESLHGLKNINEPYFQGMHFVPRERPSSTSAMGSSTSAAKEGNGNGKGKGKLENHDT